MTTPVNWTTRFRLWFVLLFSATAIVAIYGWYVGKDPGQLDTVLTWTAAALGIGEAANVGKRATHRSEGDL